MKNQNAQNSLKCQKNINFFHFKVLAHVMVLTRIMVLAIVCQPVLSLLWCQPVLQCQPVLWCQPVPVLLLPCVILLNHRLRWHFDKNHHCQKLTIVEGLQFWAMANKRKRQIYFFLVGIKFKISFTQQWSYLREKTKTYNILWSNNNKTFSFTFTLFCNKIF